MFPGSLVVSTSCSLIPSQGKGCTMVWYISGRPLYQSSQCNKLLYCGASSMCTKLMNNDWCHLLHDVFIIMQCIEIGTSYDSKQKWINKGLMFLSKSSKSVSTSHHCFELLMNSVLLDTSLEKLDHALGIMEMVLFGSSRKPCTLNVSQGKFHSENIWY